MLGEPWLDVAGVAPGIDQETELMVPEETLEVFCNCTGSSHAGALDVKEATGYGATVTGI